MTEERTERWIDGRRMGSEMDKWTCRHVQTEQVASNVLQRGTLSYSRLRKEPNFWQGLRTDEWGRRESEDEERMSAMLLPVAHGLTTSGRSVPRTATGYYPSLVPIALRYSASAISRRYIIVNAGNHSDIARSAAGCRRGRTPHMLGATWDGRLTSSARGGC